MSAIRRAATFILRVVVERGPADSRGWGSAMLREMDFIDGDWPAVRWALGSITAVGRLSLTQTFARRVISVLSGAAVGVGILTLCVVTLSGLTHASSFEPGRARLVTRLFVIVIPAVIYLVGVVAIWKQRRRVASAILAAGAILVTHSIVYLATYS